MSYSYEAEKPWLFSDEGQRAFLKVRDEALRLLTLSGAFKGLAPCYGAGCGDNWKMLACLDRLIELGEIRRIEQRGHVAGQDEIYVDVRPR